MKTAKEIIEILKNKTFIEMSTETDMLIIWFRKFFRTEKEFLFELNCKAVKSLRSNKAAEKNIQNFIDNGFTINED